MTRSNQYTRAHRTAPGSHFGGGHVENRILETDERVWMPSWVWAVVGVVGGVYLAVGW